MDYCFVVPDPLGTARQPQARQFTFPPPHRFDSRNESASHNSISAQQTINSLDSPHTLSLSYNDLVLVPQDTQIPSVSDAELTATATGPTPKRRKKKAPTLRAKDWERYKARILELHDTQNLPLPKVKEMIEEEFGFVAEYGIIITLLVTQNQLTVSQTETVPNSYNQMGQRQEHQEARDGSNCQEATATETH